MIILKSMRRAGIVGSSASLSRHVLSVSSFEFCSDSTPPPEKKSTSNDNWGLKYNEADLDKQEEWSKIVDAKHEKTKKHLQERLNDSEKAKVELVAEKMLALN